MRVLLALVLALALSAAAYGPALQGGFMFDDFPNIVDNPSIQLKTFSLAGLGESLSGLRAGPLGRPVSIGSFALTHLAFGLDPYAFKAINLLIHLVNGLLVWVFVDLLLRATPAPGLSDGMRRWLPVWTAAIWLAHPIHFVAVMMAVQRMTLLAGTFTLLALIAHLKFLAAPSAGASRWGWLTLGWGVCWPLSFLSKETGLLFPLFAMLTILFAGAPERHDHRRRIAWVLGGAAILLIGAGMFRLIGWSWLEAGYAVRDFTLQERLLTQARVLWFYLGQIALPSHASFALYLDWFPLSRGLLAPPSTLLAIACGIGLGGLAIHFRKSSPMLAFALLWFLVGHGLESTFIPLEIAHEHRNYLPSLGPLLAIGYYGALALGRVKMDRASFTMGLAALSVAAVLLVLTSLRAAQASDPLRGPQIEATRHPDSARANYVAGWALIKAGYGDRNDPMGAHNIRFYFEQAEKSDPGFKIGYLSLLTWACASRREIEKEWIDAFARKLGETAFGHGQKPLPGYLLRPLAAMPGCIAREDAVRLFLAGAGNPRLDALTRADFLGAAAEYEWKVSDDVISARGLVERAIEQAPQRQGLLQERFANLR